MKIDMKMIKVTGNTNDLLYVNEKENYMAIRFVVDDNVMVELTSVDENNEHPLIKSLLNNEVEITITKK